MTAGLPERNLGAYTTAKERADREIAAAPKRKRKPPVRPTAVPVQPPKPKPAAISLTPKEYREQQKVWEKGLSKEERKSINLYTGTKGFHTIRNCQRLPAACDKATSRHAENIRKALARAPKFEGKVYRGLNFKNQNERTQFVARVLRDGGMTDKGVTSTTRGRRTAEQFALNFKTGKAAGQQWDKSVMVRVQSKGGVDIAKLSRAKEEKEILMPANTQWKLSKVSKKKITLGGKQREMVVLDMVEI